MPWLERWAVKWALAFVDWRSDDFEAACIGILITMALALVRAFLRPTVFDRILAVNMFGTKTVLLIAVLGYMAGRQSF